MRAPLLVCVVVALALAGGAAALGQFSPRADNSQLDRAAITGVLTAQQEAWTVSYTHLTLPTICSV